MKRRILFLALYINLYWILPGTVYAQPDTAAYPIPQWLTDDWAARIQGSGTWVTDNAAYQSEQEPFDAYGIEWTYGLGNSYLKGRLYGIKEGMEARTFWEFIEYWDPALGEARVIQIGDDGTVGKGRIWKGSKDRIKERQVFTSPDGTTFEGGHVIWIEDGEQHTQSYSIVDGVWKKHRYYVWENVEL